MTPMIKPKQPMPNSKALRKLSNDVKIASDIWDMGIYIYMNADGEIESSSGKLVDWNTLTKEFKDSWVKYDL